ncbi:hypothetical protein U9M48_004628 [Paspalum notatum var. saurae]|uniref:Defensin n=1 Tax=Paspalum notatum var. saurae TaxID=547442 RepID=A0AAQ3SEZ2_PASNO
MESSSRNTFASAAVLLLLVAYMATEMMLVAAGECQERSQRYEVSKSWCTNKDCREVCQSESPKFTGGECTPVFGDCYCKYHCP